MLNNKLKDDLSKALGLSSDDEFDSYMDKLNHLTNRYKDVSRIEDSVDEKAIASSLALINSIESLKILDSSSTVVIWGCGYSSILIPYLSHRVAKVIAIDKDDDVIKFIKNKLFPEYDNIEFITDDVFSTHRAFYLETDLIVNPSCDFMLPMKDWPWFKHGAMSTDPDYPRGAGDRDPNKKRAFNTPKLSSNCHFAFQSSSTFGLKGSTNCVSSLDAFKLQLPFRAQVQFENSMATEGGEIYTLSGKLG